MNVTAQSADGDAPIEFDRDIRPILSNHCFQCHGPDGEQRKGGLRLDLKDDAFAKRDGVPPLARAELQKLTPALRLIGHITPLVLFALAAAFSESLLAIAGVAAVTGGVMWKFTVITRACHQQGFAMPKMPQRGSGNRAAPARLGGL